jgi:Uma2 family endonuclease
MTPATTKIDLAEYYAMDRRGEFAERRVELIDGEIIERPMQSNHHALSIEKGYRVLSALFGPNFWVRAQATLDLAPHSAPDPDLAVIDGSLAANSGPDNPTSALLVVEVSGTTLSSARHRKASLYAASGIRDYWIVDLEDRQLEIHRDPVPDTTSDFGFRYASVTIHSEAEFASPLAMPSGRVAVRDLLP